MEGRRGGFIGSMAGWTRTEWRTLLVALAISLAVHAALLATRRPAREGDARSPTLVVRLVTPPVPAARPPVAAAAPAAPATQGVPQPIAIPSVQAPPAPAPAPVPGPAVPPSPAPAHSPAPPSSPAPAATETAQTPDDAATPVSTPELGEVARLVVGRRLQTTLWISAQGRVEKASVKRNELAEEVAQSLEQALSAVRFTPALLHGEPVPSVLETRLCFDAAGVLDTSSAECLRPAAEGAAPPENR